MTNLDAERFTTTLTLSGAASFGTTTHPGILGVRGENSKSSGETLRKGRAGDQKIAPWLD